MSRIHFPQASIAMLMTLLLAGCSASQSVIRDPSRLVRDPGVIIGRPKYEPNVIRIVSLWEPASGRDPNDKPARGFAGQVLFFGPSSQAGSRIHGKVVIYEYKNFDPEASEDPTPLHSFTFEPDAWELHRTEGTLGHSYNCFIPLMSSSREQENCALMVEYIDEDGRKVRSEYVEVLLPSRSASTAAAKATRGFVRESQIGGKLLQASATTATQPPATDSQPDKLESLSIPLPKRR
jgi:hypothetical protein